MTPDQIELVQESFRHVAPIREKAAELFYGRLLSTDPSTVPLFARSDMALQGQKLMAALAMVVSALDQPEKVVPVARDMAKRHLSYGVRQEHYASVGAALIWTLQRGLGPAFTPEVEAAWKAAYAALSGAMIEAAYAPA